MSSLTGHLSLFATQSLKSIDKWMATANANLNGSLRVGFRESDITFGGNTVNILKETSQTVNGIQVGEQALTVGATRLNWTNGEVVSSTEDSHYAISGEGFFMVYDPEEEKIYYTRDGEFRENAAGQCVNAQGLVLIDGALAINLGLSTLPADPNFPYTAPTTSTAAEIASHETTWEPLANVGTNGGAPYWVNGFGSESDSTIQVKKTFFIDKNAVTGPVNLGFAVDNIGFLYVNGQLVYDGVAGWTPEVPGSPKDISGYLRDGANTIMIQASNVSGPAGINITGSIPGAALDGSTVDLSSAGGQWAAKSIPKVFSADPPSNSELTIKAKDILIANTARKDDLRYSKYGSTFFQADFPGSEFVIGQPETKGLGKVSSKALESSNVSFDSNIAQLAALGKMYNGFVQVIKVYNSALDEVLGFIR